MRNPRPTLAIACANFQLVNAKHNYATVANYAERGHAENPRARGPTIPHRSGPLTVVANWGGGART
eukprot:5158240-Lingulodinium_polyedra.AAC.1